MKHKLIETMQRTKKKPAVVRFIGNSNSVEIHTEGEFTPGMLYDAFFLEYWESSRDALHVRDDNGKITYFNHFGYFSVISDEDNLLNDYEAIVRCVTHEFDDEFLDLKYGQEYKAIGVNSEGEYLVMDESHVCYFYNPECFEIVEDKNNTLKQQVYWWFEDSVDDSFYAEEEKTKDEQ